jgi:DmsE family decaheme c-type cytochrome
MTTRASLWKWGAAALFAFVVSGATAPAAAESAEFVGAESCLSCHEDMSHFKKNIHAKAMKNTKGVVFEKTCESCHGPGSKHVEAAGDRDNPGFYSVKNLGSSRPKVANESCLECHTGGTRMHWKGSTHDMKNVGCVTCHSMHDHKTNKGKTPLLKAKSGSESCYKCHGEKKAQIRKSGHMPLVEGKMGCTGCHNPHGSLSDNLLVKNTVPETCYTCHQDKRGPFMWEHAPSRENCSTCHNPHGSHHENMLVTRSPLLCQRCHVGGRHPSSVYGQSQVDAQSNRLMYKGCVNCHPKVHGTNHPSGKWLNR